jgi:hypothetical protein
MIMKKIFIIAAVLSFALLQACKKDKLVTVSSNITAPVVTSPSDGTAIVVTTADSAQTFNITWTKPDYGVSAVVNYFVQVDSVGNNFKTNVTLANLTNATSYALSYNQLNSKLIAGLNLAPNALATVEFRVGAAIYGADTVFSKPVKMAITTLAVNQLWLPGSYQGYSPGTAPTIPALTPTTYEGYAYFSAPGNFKFTSAPDYGHTNYGDGGNGKLTTDGNAGGIGYASAGVYKLNADISALTYSAVFISTFGIIGTATPQQWNASTPMTYSTSTGLWTVKVALVAGALKFRANDAWDINYGPASANDLTGTLIFNDPGAVTITDAGNYIVTLDMTQSKTKTYNYTIVKD